ncbi:MAG: hypothetical protein FJ102_01935 [Deltaproteobacteria bacterium]|nr:hypothetical protein [Deltaproteobacteria bacterium]
MLFALLVACSPFEGSWYLVPDLASQDVAGDCADDYELDGNAGLVIDIYRLGNGQVAVMLGQALIGVPAGNELEASYEESLDGKVDGTHVSIEDSARFEAVVSGDVMEGLIEEDYVEEIGGEDYDCFSETPFTAYRILSGRDSYVKETAVESSE